MNQEKLRRLARWRLPSGVYNPVVTADGRRWRDYERAAETQAPPPEPFAERGLKERGWKERRLEGRIAALMNGSGSKDGDDPISPNGKNGFTHGFTGTGGAVGPQFGDLFVRKIKTVRAATDAVSRSGPGGAADGGRTADRAEELDDETTTEITGAPSEGADDVAGERADGTEDAAPGGPAVASGTEVVTPESATPAFPLTTEPSAIAELPPIAELPECDWLDRPGRPPRLEETRPYGRAGGLAEPDPRAQACLAQAVSERFPDPRGMWIRLINAEGPSEDPFRATNALDCSLAVISTWHGEPVVAARRHPEYDVLGRPLPTGEVGGVARAEEWLGHRFEYMGHGRRAYVAIAQRLIFGGHGASAVLITRWPTGGSHAWNAVNWRGEVLWIDAQRGHMAVEPPYEEVTGVFSVVIDRHGQQL